ncbi:universal stress protein [Natronorubrum sp. DTA7]|uniref:universal stress protein n=1 Tax=Natronorubrum sp. DTA7 TaxID=3447016 RepID=UPI003F87B06E
MLNGLSAGGRIDAVRLVPEPSCRVLAVSPGRRPAASVRSRRFHLEAAAAVATDAGVEDVETLLGFGSVPQEIQSAAAGTGVDLVVMATHGRTGVGQHLLGSNTEQVLRTAPVPVFTTGVADDGDR